MNSSLKLALCTLAVALSSAPVALAQDMSQPATPPPAAAPSSDTTTPPAAAPAAPSDDTSAPKKHGNKGGSAKILNNLTEKLSLTDDQKTKVGAILKDSMAQNKTITSDTTLSDDDKKAKMDALHKSTHDQIRALLTDDQKTTFDAMPPMGERGGKKKDNN